MLIASHPFYTGLLTPGEGLRQPASLPFELVVDERLALPRLVLTDVIRDALTQAYAVGSMASTPLGESDLASVRMRELIAQLLDLNGGTLQGRTLLEVGCGNGELLNQLRHLGAVVTGLEIGPQAQVVEDRYGIRVIREPLAAGSLDERFDCILSYGCLEHIEDLEGFFAASRSCLNEHGLFLHSVPNAALGFERGALDQLLHEHINYFTPPNALAVLTAAGFRDVGAVPTRAGNELMLWGHSRAGTPARWPSEGADEQVALLDDFAGRLQQRVHATVAWLRGVTARGETVAFYAGGFEYGFHLADPAVRFVDGDDYKHGKQWLPGLRPIEAPEQLLAHPVDYVVVCKPHYGAPIRAGLTRLGVDPRSLVDIDALAQASGRNGEL